MAGTRVAAKSRQKIADVTAERFVNELCELGSNGRPDAVDADQRGIDAVQTGARGQADIVAGNRGAL